MRCRKCRATLICKKEGQCIINCHGSQDADACDQDKLVTYIQEELMPPWLAVLVEQVIIVQTSWKSIRIFSVLILWLPREFCDAMRVLCWLI